MDAREAQFRKLTEQFPDSPLGWFSLGRYLLEAARHEEAAAALERALVVDPQYAAALLALGDAYTGLEETERARQAFERCAEAALAQSHPTLAAEARERIEEL